MSNTDDELDKILGSIKLGYNGDDDNPVDYYLEETDYREAKQAIKDLIDRVIGEDEKGMRTVYEVGDISPVVRAEKRTRNKLRQTQRQALRELGDE